LKAQKRDSEGREKVSRDKERIRPSAPNSKLSGWGMGEAPRIITRKEEVGAGVEMHHGSKFHQEKPAGGDIV